MGKDPACRKTVTSLAILFLAITLPVAHLAQSISGNPSQKQILATYRPFFRTQQEQKAVADVFFSNDPRRVIPSITTNPPGSGHDQDPSPDCNSQCQDPFPRADNQSKGTDDDKVVRNACCLSIGSFFTPVSARTIDGVDMTVVQFAQYKQYFPTENCSQVRNCPYCTCYQKNTYTSAVVRDASIVNVTLIEIPGCCKCYNN
ncbi:hypothetical protein RRG08_053361 [Elysia crispata]|uniref:Spaetzle domain-containing protein n=1 Tax=Elysia crispata TaxID=231223 RepID=A0AAE0ZKJ6_9GAST|nr:hypothetical protein RRG08_053361 [Elysia crispata]